LFERKGRMEERFGIVLHETILKDSAEALTIIQSGDQTYSLFTLLHSG